MESLCLYPLFIEYIVVYQYHEDVNVLTMTSMYCSPLGYLNIHWTAWCVHFSCIIFYVRYYVRTCIYFVGGGARMPKSAGPKTLGSFVWTNTDSRFCATVMLLWSTGRNMIHEPTTSVSEHLANQRESSDLDICTGLNKHIFIYTHGALVCHRTSC